MQRTYQLCRPTRAPQSPPVTIGSLYGRSFGIVVTFNIPGVRGTHDLFGTPPDLLFKAGHNSAGVNAPSTSWFLAEGATGTFLRNVRAARQPEREPGRSLSPNLKFLPQSGAAVTRSVTIPARRAPHRQYRRPVTGSSLAGQRGGRHAGHGPAASSSWSARSIGPTRRINGTRRTTAQA